MRRTSIAATLVLLTSTFSVGYLSLPFSDDEAQLRSLVEKFFATYAKKDLDGFMALWSEKSPDYASRKQTIQQLFAANDFNFANLAISRVKVEANKASLRAAVDSTTTDVRTKQADKERMIRAIAFVKDGDGWKVGRYYPAVDDLAAALIESKTENDRKALLDAEKELVTVELRQALIAQGNRLYSTGNSSQALGVYQFAQGISELIGDRAGIAATLNNMGVVLRLQGRYAEALDSYQKSLTVSEALGHRTGIAATLTGIGNIHSSQGRYAEALDSYQKSLTIFEALDDRGLIAGTLTNISNVHRLQGRYAEALDSDQRSLTIFEALGDRVGIALTLNNIGIVHQLQRRYAEALESYQKSLTMSEAVGDRAVVALTLNNIGEVHRLQERYVEALDSYQKSLTIKEALGDRAGIAQTLNNIGRVHEKQERYVEALDSYQKSLTIAEAIGVPNTAFLCHWGIGNVHKAQGGKDEAIVDFRKAIEQLESIRSHVAGREQEEVSYLQAEGKDEVYDSLAMLLVERGRVKEALTTLERARSKRLLDGIRLGALKVSNPALHDQLLRTEALEQALAAHRKVRSAELARPESAQNAERIKNLNDLIAGAEAELVRVMSAIRETFPEYEQLVRVTSEDPDEIVRRLPGNAAVVEYVPLKESLLILLVTQKGSKARIVPVPRERLEALVEEFHLEMVRARKDHERAANWDWHSPRARRLRQTLTDLYQYLISPIEKDLTPVETVVFLPSGSLNYVPFQALARERTDAEIGRRGDGETTARSPRVAASPRPPVASLRFLTEEKNIAVLTSLHLWSEITRSPKGRSGQRLAGFGDPDGSLPGAEREVKAVAGMFSDSLVFMGQEATRAHLQSLPGNVSIAHLATHGRLDARDINECYLLLAQGEKFKLGDIYELKGRYPARLTVLSACQSAIGRSDPGREVAHLARSFVMAGSTTIIASLWKVSDESTAILMERFYKELKAGKTKAEAKRQAEISLLKNPRTAHPYYWAPFVLIGDWR